MSTCEGFMSIPVLGLNAGQHYTASVVVFNNKNSFKSKSIDVCEWRHRQFIPFKDEYIY